MRKKALVLAFVLAAFAFGYAQNVEPNQEPPPWQEGGSGIQPFIWPVKVTNFPTEQPVVGTVDVGNLPAVQAVAGSVSVDNLPTVQQVEGTVEVSNLGNAASETTILLDVDVVLDENTVGWTSPPFDVGAFRQVSIGINKSGSTPHCTIEWEWFDGGGFVGTDVFFGVATLPVRATRGRISCGIDNLNQVIVLHSAAIYA